MHSTPIGGSGRRTKLFALWYACIAAGFLLLAVRAWVLGAPRWTVILRGLIAGGFGLLAWLEHRGVLRR